MKIDFPELLMLLLLMIHPIPKYRPNVIEINKNIQTLLMSYSPKISYVNNFDDELEEDVSASIKSFS